MLCARLAAKGTGVPHSGHFGASIAAGAACGDFENCMTNCSWGRSRCTQLPK